MTASPTIEIVSIGSAAAQLQAPVATIRKAAESLGILPAFRINEIAHFTPSDLERIGRQIQEARESHQ